MKEILMEATISRVYMDLKSIILLHLHFSVRMMDLTLTINMLLEFPNSIIKDKIMQILMNQLSPFFFFFSQNFKNDELIPLFWLSKKQKMMSRGYAWILIPLCWFILHIQNLKHWLTWRVIAIWWLQLSLIGLLL